MTPEEKQKILELAEDLIEGFSITSTMGLEIKVDRREFEKAINAMPEESDKYARIMEENMHSPIAMPEESEWCGVCKQPFEQFERCHCYPMIQKETDNQIAKRNYLRFLKAVGLGGHGVSDDEYLNWLDKKEIHEARVALAREIGKGGGGAGPWCGCGLPDCNFRKPDEEEETDD